MGATELNCKFIRLSGCKVVIIAESDFHFKVESPLRDAKGKPRHVYELKCEGKADFVSWTEKIRSEIENAAATRVGLVGAASAGISLDKTVLNPPGCCLPGSRGAVVQDWRSCPCARLRRRCGEVLRLHHQQDWSLGRY